MRTDCDWRKWGEIDPYFGVIPCPEFRADRIAGNRDYFFETGRRDIAEVLDKITRFYGDISTLRALDFGSGVGRLVLPLAEHFDHVVGVDISDAMIAEARRNCANAGVHNVEFVMSDDMLSAVRGPFDLVHSRIVLQHIPIDRGLALTNRMLSLLNPNGVAMLHFSLQRTLTPLGALVSAIKNHIPLGRNVANLLKGRDWNRPGMQMYNYPLTEIVRTFEKNRLADVIVLPEWHLFVLTAHVFGRKAPAC